MARKICSVKQQGILRENAGGGKQEIRLCSAVSLKNLSTRAAGTAERHVQGLRWALPG
jgi:hypothetical protein